MAFYMVKPWYKKSGADNAIYGAEWDGSSNPAWTRTDAAANFSDPNPQYALSNSTYSVGSSPFDNIMPWAGVVRVSNSQAGELVEIPKFYYKWTRTGSAMKLQISMTKHDGFLCSPAHADRGDNIGERDYVYVGRYHCVSSYKSATGEVLNSVSRSSFRSRIHNLGTNVWQWDFAMRWTISMLYLVEFAHWDSQLKIGFGCGVANYSSSNGMTDAMTYHTGTNKLSRDTYGQSTQYRHIEGLWDNVVDWIDGIYFSGADIYCIKNPNNFGIQGGVKVGQRATPGQNGGLIRSFTNPTVSGYEYALYAATTGTASDDYESYVTDITYSTSANALAMGGYYDKSRSRGLFAMHGDSSESSSNGAIGSRVMVLPSSRLTS